MFLFVDSCLIVDLCGGMRRLGFPMSPFGLLFSAFKNISFSLFSFFNLIFCFFSITNKNVFVVNKNQCNSEMCNIDRKHSPNPASFCVHLHAYNYNTHVILYDAFWGL